MTLPRGGDNFLDSACGRGVGQDDGTLDPMTNARASGLYEGWGLEAAAMRLMLALMAVLLGVVLAGVLYGAFVLYVWARGAWVLR